MELGYIQLISVVVPVYNAESTIQRCLESIFNQSYKEFELILVDDGSTDKTPAICDMYAQMDNRIVVIHTDNFGPFQARKIGAEKASGKILTFLDADDWIDDNTFDSAMKVFYRYNPDILAYTYDCARGKTEKHLYEEKFYCKTEIDNTIIPGMMYDCKFGKRRLNPSLCCKLIKKDLFMKVTKSVKDRITLADDALVTYPAVCLAESMVIWNKTFYHYSNNPVSCTHQYPLERITELKAFQNNLFRLFDEIGILSVMKWQAENYIRSFLPMMIRNWFEMEFSPVMFSFPYYLISKGKRIFIYGAGNVGKSYINELKLTNYAEVVGCADENYDHLKEYNSVDVIEPEKITQKVFDVLLIAVWDEKVANEIKDNLVNMGIDKNKIIWIQPKSII